MTPRFRARWLTGFLVALVVTVNLAGIGGIAIARRTALEEAQLVFRQDVESRAAALESLLSAIRADLAFIAASSPVGRLDEAADKTVAAWRREGAESALLLFLRAHPEVVRVLGRSASGQPLVHTGRRGGVPVLWVSANPTGHEGAAVDPDRPRLTTTLYFEVEDRPQGGKFSLETEVEPSSLVPHGPFAVEGQGPPTCSLLDETGRPLVRPPRRARRAEPDRRPLVTAPVRAEGWSAPGPWRLECEQAQGRAGGRVAALTSRYRATLRLNIGVMALTLLLGSLAVYEARRRERMEARAREETRVRELERQLFHVERLTTVGRLAAGIAHEINNPLEGMANWLSLARDSAQRGDLPAAADHLGRVKEGLDRAAGIVRQVLAHADPAKAPHEPTDLKEVLRENYEFVRSRKEFANVAFSLELAEADLTVRGSPVMLGQIAVNLILNACEAQPEGGEVHVTARREGKEAIAEVADRGPGISAGDRERIFEPFFSTKHSTGLGLSICHSIARTHGGELVAVPRDGGGTVFRLKLPALEA